MFKDKTKVMCKGIWQKGDLIAAQVLAGRHLVEGSLWLTLPGRTGQGEDYLYRAPVLLPDFGGRFWRGACVQVLSTVALDG